MGVPSEMDQFEYFRQMGGRFRISLTSHCNARCWFCHNEGDVPPWQVDELPMVQHKPKLMTTADYITLVHALLDIGVKRLYLTGGEPLLSPMLTPILAAIPVHSPDDFRVSIATNGVLLDRKIKELSALPVDKIKISLHAFTNETMMKIEKLACIEKVKNAIRLAKTAFPEVEINTLLMPENEHEIMDIISFALDVGVDIEVLELVWTKHDDPVYQQKRLGTREVADTLVRLGGQESVENMGMGVNLHIVDLGGIRVKLMDETLGRLYVGTCTNCTLRRNCIEGFWAPRIDSAGFCQPCLLRDDLQLDLKPYLTNPAMLREILPKWIGSFMSGIPVLAD